GGLEARPADRIEASLSTSVDESAKQLDVEARGTGGSRVPLHADRKPMLVFRFDGLDHAVQGASTYPEATCEAADGAPVLTIDDNFAFAIESRQTRPALDVDGMPITGFIRVLVL